MKSLNNKKIRTTSIVLIIIAVTLITAILGVFFVTAIVGFDLRRIIYSDSSARILLSNYGGNNIGVFETDVCRGKSISTTSETEDSFIVTDDINGKTVRFVYAGQEYAYFTTNHEGKMQLNRCKYDTSETELLYEYELENSSVPEVDRNMINEWTYIYPQGDHYVLYNLKTKDVSCLSLEQYKKTYQIYSVKTQYKRFINKEWAVSWTIKNEITNVEKTLTLKDLENNELFQKMQKRPFAFCSTQVDGNDIYIIYGNDMYVWVEYVAVFRYSFENETVEYVGWGETTLGKYTRMHYCIWDNTQQS